MAIFVTGAAGFLGRATIALLVHEGLEVVAVTRSAAAFAAPVRCRRVANYEELLAEGGNDTLIHLAEMRDLRAAEADGQNYFNRTVARTETLLGQPWRYVIYASSAAVYGDASMTPRTPGESVVPLSIYGKAKRLCEQLVLSRRGAVARFANLVGPGMAPDNVLSEMLRQLSDSGPVFLRDLSPVRDFLAVEDAAAGILAILKSGERGIFNFGSGRGTSVADLVQRVLVIAAQSDRPVEETAPSGNMSHLVLDISASEERLGWRPRISLDDAIASILRKNS